MNQKIQQAEQKAGSLWKEFKHFSIRGNAIDLAVGVIIGGAFGKIVTSIVNDILTPIIGALFGGVKFTDRYIALNGIHYETLQAAQAQKAPLLMYGSFIQNIIDFLIIAVIIFIFVKGINKLMRAPEKKKDEKPPLTKDQQLLTEIRDALKK
jgi:large conductance mechanosensitive channel